MCRRAGVPKAWTCLLFYEWTCLFPHVYFWLVNKKERRKVGGQLNPKLFKKFPVMKGGGGGGGIRTPGSGWFHFQYFAKLTKCNMHGFIKISNMRPIYNSSSGDLVVIPVFGFTWMMIASLGIKRNGIAALFYVF